MKFSCAASDPDTEYLDYTWYVDEIEVSQSQYYIFDMPPGEYTVHLEVSDGINTATYQWDVTVLGSPNFAKIQNRLERIRGLKFLEPVDRVEIDRAQLRESLMADLNEDLELINKEKALYVALHVMDPEEDLYQLYVDLLTSQVASYYDTGDHTFYEVVDPDEPVICREFVAAHELTHALQDQYGYLDVEFENDDEYLAFLCVVEGDAMFHQYMYLDEMTQFERNNLFEYINTLDIPVVNVLLENIIMLSYRLGLEFVTTMSFTGSVDSLYERLPASTEQVMHPEKYIADELPVPVSVPSLPGWEKLTENTLGEAIMKTILTEHISSDKAGEAAEGWGGDRYCYYTKGSDHIFVLNTFWDTEEDAEEFFKAYHDFTDSWSNKAVTEVERDIYRVPTGFLALVRKGDHVLIVESPSLEAVKEALSLLKSYPLMVAVT